MDTLKAAYKDDDDEIDPVSTPPLVTAVDGSASTGTKLATADVTSDTKSESDHVNGMKDDSQAPASEDLSSSEETPQAPDGDDEEDEEGDEEEERPPKKQKQLLDTPKPETSGIEITEMPSPADAITPLSQNGNPPTATATATKSSKKSKKKSKDVWVTTTRKGRKKTKHAFNSDQNGHVSKESKVLIAPIPRFPDKNDDSPDLKICLSKVYKAEKVELSEDRLSAGSSKGYRMVRATRGVIEGSWYFEIKVVHLGETGHTRLGWSTEKGDLQAPVGYDGNSFGYRDIDGSKVHKALREGYGEEGYKEGDVIGFYINLPDGGSYAPDLSRMVWYKGQRYASALDANEDTPKVVPGSEISYYKNGICQGVAFKDLYGGRYYPAASMYTLPNQPNCVVKFNFGPDFESFPDNFGERPVPRPMIEIPYQSYDARVENGVSIDKKL